LRQYIDSTEIQERLYKKTLVVVVLSQLFGGAGLAAGVTVGALLARDLLGSDGAAGIPSALLTLGSAAAALLVGRLSQRAGRRWGLTVGFLAGGVGAIGVVVAAVMENLPLFFASLLLYGFGGATNLLARYAGTDLAKPGQRARAVSIALVSTTFGAVAGPNSVGAMGDFAASIGIPPLAGPFLLGAAAYLLAGFVLFAWLRPDPFLVAKALHEARESQSPAERDGAPAAAVRTASDRRGLVVGASVMIVTQIVMVAVMTMTPIHMGHHGFGLSDVGLVIGFHIGAMYLPSLATGALVDKVGRTTMAVAAGVSLVAAALLAAFAPGHSLASLIAALALLGLGWNFGLISGTTLVVDATHPADRAKTQGAIDVSVALAGATGGALSGLVVEQASFAALSLAGAALALLLLPVVLRSGDGRRKERSSS
jgi:MFS family permease